MPRAESPVAEGTSRIGTSTFRDKPFLGIEARPCGRADPMSFAYRAADGKPMADLRSSRAKPRRARDLPTKGLSKALDERLDSTRSA
jgi:hypothetical protein